jgi:hypothetical protein
MILVPLFDLKFLIAFAASDAGTSNRRHEAAHPPIEIGEQELVNLRLAWALVSPHPD